MTPDNTTDPSRLDYTGHRYDFDHDRDDYKRLADMGRAALPTETNAEVERDADRQGRSATARELQACLSVIALHPDDLDARSRFSADMIAVAQALLPAVLDLTQRRAEADALFEALVDQVNEAVDLLDLCAEVEYLMGLGAL